MNQDLMDAFFLGVRCAEYAATTNGERSKAIFRTLMGVACGEITLIDSPEETARMFGGLPDDWMARVREFSTRARVTDQDLARKIISFPEDREGTETR